MADSEDETCINTEIDKKDFVNRRMLSSWTLRRVVLVRTDVSEEPNFLRNMLWLLLSAVVPNSSILMMHAMLFSETSVLKKVIWSNVQEDGILQKKHISRKQRAADVED
jgi:hypothetical protein